MHDQDNRSRDLYVFLAVCGFALVVGAGALTFGLSRFLREETPSLPTAETVHSNLSAPAHEIIPGSGLFYLGSDTSYGYTASYAIATSEGVIVIDPGLRFDTLREQLMSLDLAPSAVKLALITHRHADHWFASRELVARTGARILAGANEIPVMTQAADLRHYFSIYGTPMTDVPILTEVEVARDGDIIQLGDAKIEVLETPGHTPGSLCFRTRIQNYDVLFSGDTIMTLTPEATDGDYMTRIGSQFGGDLPAYIQTLKRLSTLSIDILLPGHPLLGNDMDPAAGARKWKQSVPQRIAMFEDRLKQYGTEMNVYLDGKTKELGKDIFYLGEEAGTACYVIRSGSQLVCIDPGERTMEAFQSQLDSLKLNIEEIELVLLTGVHPSHSALARALCDESGAKLYCGRVNDEAVSAALRPDKVLDSADEFQLGSVQIRALAGSPGAGADLCFLMEATGRQILLGGDSVGRFPKDPRSFHPDVNPKTLLGTLKVKAAVELIGNQNLDFVLPAHPQYQESPYYFPLEWRSRMK